MPRSCVSGPVIDAGCACIGNGGVSDGSSFNVDIGNTCDAWDGMEQYCIDYEASTKERGGANDWCPDDWCYVDPLTCDQPVYKSSYFNDEQLAAANLNYLYFSYKACSSCFAGNQWVGDCECTGNQGASDGSSFSVNMGGADVGLADVRGCQAWDGQEQYCIDYAAETKEAKLW